MPRLSTSLLRHARAENPLLVLLLRTCRTLDSARNELRWLGAHAENLIKARPPTPPSRKARRAPPTWAPVQLKKLCVRRGRGEPLQYILGTEYFGDLELRCRPGVLIPRPETADLIVELIRRLSHDARNRAALPRPLHVLDLCTGTGCMSLLLRHELGKAFGEALDVNILGVDICRKAIALARENKRRLKPEDSKHIHFAIADVLGAESQQPRDRDALVASPPSLLDLLNKRGLAECDILISNPPYISPKAFDTDTARSVRTHEPRLALVPPSPPPPHTHLQAFTSTPPPRNSSATDPSSADQEAGDTFYPHLLRLAANLSTRLLLVEVADLAQAMRVARAALLQMHSDPGDVVARRVWDCVEIWRDGIGDVGVGVGAGVGDVGVGEVVVVDGGHDEGAGERGVNVKIRVKGPKGGCGRAVVCWRGAAGAWVGGHREVDSA